MLDADNKEDQKLVFFSHLELTIISVTPKPVFVKKEPKKLYGEYIDSLKPFEMILYWEYIAGNKTEESGLFCSSNLESEFYKKKKREK